MIGAKQEWRLCIERASFSIQLIERVYKNIDQMYKTIRFITSSERYDNAHPALEHIIGLGTCTGGATGRVSD